MIHKFIDNIPREIEDDVICVSIKYRTAIHKCPCGCGNEVITPIDEINGWKLIFNGKSISLYPSIGNWNLKCQSHYWINKNQIIWAKPIKKKKYKNTNKNKKRFSFKYLINFKLKNGIKASNF